MISAASDLAESQRRANNTLAIIKAGIESGQAPLVSQIVQVIRDLSGRADQMSVTELAETISRDPTTMSRIISIAGSLGYNPNGVEVTSIHQAIALIGFERIRNLAVSLLLVENADQKCTADTNRETSGLALASGLLAADMCRRGVPVDPDLAFLCGALRSYGRMLMATFMADDFSSVVKLAQSGTTDATFRATFGITPLELGRELLASMSLPPIILNSLRDLPKETVHQAETNPATALVAVADFALRVAESIASPELTAENFSQTVQSIAAGYGDQFKLSPEGSRELIQSVSLELDSFSSKAGTARESTVLFNRLEAIADERPLPPAYVPAERPRPDASLGPGPKTDTSLARNSPAGRLLGAVADEFSRLLSAPNPEPRQLFSLLIGTLQKALEIHGCIIFIKERGGPRFHAGYGCGALFNDNQTIQLDPSEKRVFALPLKRGEDVLIQNPDDEKMRNFVPEWLRKRGQILPFFLLPVKDELGPFALVCATSTSHESFALVTRFSAELRRIRAQLAPLGKLVAGRQPSILLPAQTPPKAA